MSLSRYSMQATCSPYSDHDCLEPLTLNSLLMMHWWRQRNFPQERFAVFLLGGAVLLICGRGSNSVPRTTYTTYGIPQYVVARNLDRDRVKSGIRPLLITNGVLLHGATSLLRQCSSSLVRDSGTGLYSSNLRNTQYQLSTQTYSVITDYARSIMRRASEKRHIRISSWEGSVAFKPFRKYAAFQGSFIIIATLKLAHPLISAQMTGTHVEDAETDGGL